MQPMTTLIKSMQRVEQQLHDLIYDDGTKVFASVNIAPLREVREDMLPCAILSTTWGTSIEVLCLLPRRDDMMQSEFQAMAMWDTVWKHLQIRAQIGMMSYQGEIYQVVRFSIGVRKQLTNM